jgi:hypothetical protein
MLGSTNKPVPYSFSDTKTHSAMAEKLANKHTAAMIFFMWFPKKLAESLWMHSKNPSLWI